MIQRIGGPKEHEGYDVTCDGCPHAESFDVRTWTALLAMLAGTGWRSQKQGGEWMNYCPDCSEE